MIAQRNISLLSNRLAAGGHQRIREDVLERDDCLAWFLSGLSQSELRSVLAFKGGTALKRCYFPDYRFSEDLDFTLREPLPFEQLGAQCSVTNDTHGVEPVDRSEDGETLWPHRTASTTSRR